MKSKKGWISVRLSHQRPSSSHSQAGLVTSYQIPNHYILHIHNWWIVIMIFWYIWIWMALILLCPQMQYLSWRRFIFLYTWPQMYLYLYFSPNAVQYFSWRRFIFLCIWPPGLWVGKPILPSSNIFVKQSKDTSIENSFSKTHTLNMAPIFTTLCCKILIFEYVCLTF